jgi:hypothetical protein
MKIVVDSANLSGIRLSERFETIFENGAFEVSHLYVAKR